MLHRSFKLEKKNYLCFLETSLREQVQKKNLRKLGHMPNHRQVGSAHSIFFNEKKIGQTQRRQICQNVMSILLGVTIFRFFLSDLLSLINLGILASMRLRLIMAPLPSHFRNIPRFDCAASFLDLPHIKPTYFL